MLKSWWGGNIKMVICDVVFNCVSLSYGKLNSLWAGPSPLGICRLRLLSRKQQQQKNASDQLCHFGRAKGTAKHGRYYI